MNANPGWLWQATQMEADDLYMFTEAVCRGNVRDAEFWQREFSITPQRLRTECYEELYMTLCKCLVRNCMPGLRFLVNTIGLNASDVRRDNGYVLHIGAGHGALRALQYLTQCFGLTKADIFQPPHAIALKRHGADWFKDIKHNTALLVAAAEGCLPVLEFLCTHFDVTPSDVRVDDNYALVQASSGGHLHVLRWLHCRFGLTPTDARSQNNAALRAAALSGCVDVLTYLHDHFGLTGDDARANDNEALVAAFHRQHWHVVKTLHHLYKLGPEDARAQQDAILMSCARMDNVCGLRHLAINFGLTAQVAASNQNAALRYAIQNKSHGVVQHLNGMGVRRTLAQACQDWWSNSGKRNVLAILWVIFATALFWWFDRK